MIYKNFQGKGFVTKLNYFYLCSIKIEIRQSVMWKFATRIA